MRRFSSVSFLDSFLQSGRRLLARRPGPASDFVWETLPSGPSPRLDAGAIQIGNLLYCIGGYVDQNKVLSVIDVWDLTRCSWGDQIPMPDKMPQSHIALATDGRFIYSAGGQ
ncbi:MAG TPA: kelch repeat-containing protein, partial [Pyrinomonadaceae bacterium]|nr:kelch repeat-containing protein [Pyrinomonadaceae bacterium]